MCGYVWIVDQSWLPTLPAFKLFFRSFPPRAQIFYAKNCRKALSVGDRVFNTRRQEVAEVIRFDDVGAHPFVGMRGSGRNGFQISWIKSEHVINATGVQKRLHVQRDVKRWRHISVPHYCHMYGGGSMKHTHTHTHLIRRGSSERSVGN